MLAQETLKKPLGPCIPNGNPSGWSGEPLGSAGETGHGAIGLCLFAGCLWQHITKKNMAKESTQRKTSLCHCHYVFRRFASMSISSNLSESK